MIPVQIIGALMLFVFVACNNHTEQSDPGKPEWTLAWTGTQGLVNPESVVYDPLNKCYYVSNSPEYDFTGKGYLAKFSTDGSLIDSTWITQLNRPTGMAIQGNSLFVGDINQLVEIDIAAARIVEKHLVSDHPQPGVNDVTINPEGRIFLTASNAHAVYELTQTGLKKWAHDSTILKWANGIATSDEGIIVAGDRLALIPYNSQQASLLHPSIDLRDFDGLQPDASGGYWVSTISDKGKVWHISADGKASLVIDTGLYAGDFALSPDHSGFIIPVGDHTQASYMLNAYHQPKPK